MKNMNCSNTITAALPSEDLTLRAVGSQFAVSFKDAAHGVFRVLCIWQERYLMRKRMANLDDHLLDDIGLTRDQVLAEADKPFWQP